MAKEFSDFEGSIPESADEFHVAGDGILRLINFDVDVSTLKPQHEKIIEEKLVPFLLAATKFLGPGDYKLRCGERRVRPEASIITRDFPTNALSMRRILPFNPLKTRRRQILMFQHQTHGGPEADGRHCGAGWFGSPKTGIARSTGGVEPSSRGLALVYLTVQRASRCFWRSFAGLSFQASGMRPSLLAFFSSRVLR